MDKLDLGEIMDRILKHCNRLRSLSITYTYEQTALIQFALDTAMQRLRDLTLRGIDTPLAARDILPSRIPFSRIVLTPLSAPALQHLHILGLELLALRSTLRRLINLELSDLQQFASRTLEWDYVIGLLQTCAGTLLELTIQDVSYEVLHQHPLPEMRFAQLRSLRVLDTQGDLMSKFLYIIRLPPTTCLDLHYQWTLGAWNTRSDAGVFTDCIFGIGLSRREEALPGLRDTGRIRLQVGKSSCLSGFRAGEEFASRRAMANVGSSHEVTCRTFGPMVSTIPQLVNLGLVEECEYHVPPYVRNL
ncbi:hypothetical protein BN946_scf184996.g60 [Trametes cinnabarina]|uniref:F-box domain-containing protein n=1 Tax=Pycnoporus cinnabarinus TaxID=5643 RepID=A0A060S8L2_PYCCI|nr:hypothetical protein BN946_scf184996.g60 [Trametes cinnabarina]